MAVKHRGTLQPCHLYAQSLSIEIISTRKERSCSFGARENEIMQNYHKRKKKLETYLNNGNILTSIFNVMFRFSKRRPPPQRTSAERIHGRSTWRCASVHCLSSVHYHIVRQSCCFKALRLDRCEEKEFVHSIFGKVPVILCLRRS